MASDSTALPPTDPLGETLDPPSHRGLRISAAVVAALGLVQAALGSFMLSGMINVRDVHGYIGYATVIAAVVAAVMAVKAVRTTGSKGTMYHAISLPVLALIQIALAETGRTVLHAFVGFVLLIAAVGLWAMSGPKPQHAAATDTAKSRLSPPGRS